MNDVFDEFISKCYDRCVWNALEISYAGAGI